MVHPMLRIKELRTGAHMSQSELARAAGLAEKTIRRVEKTGTASGKTLQRLADGLGCEIGHLFEKAEVA